MSSDAQLAYLAGLIDGEGSVTLYLNKEQTLKLKVQVYNCNEDVMDWLKVNFQGCKYKVGIRRNPKHSQELAWHISNNYACQILQQVFPYLVIKQAKARIAIEAWQNRQPTPITQRREPIPETVLALRNSYIMQFRETQGASRGKMN